MALAAIKENRLMFTPLLLPKADRYFARQFLVTFLLCLVGAAALLIVGDLLQKNDEFMYYVKKSGRDITVVLFMIVQYYAAYTPQIILQWMLPLIILFAGIITITSFSIHNEYIALRSSGISIQRAIVPILIPALLLGYAFELSRDWFMPALVRKNYEIASTVRSRSAQPLSIVVQDGDTRKSISIGHFDHQGYAHNLRIELRDINKYNAGDESFVAYLANRAALQPRFTEDGGHQWKWAPQLNPRKHIVSLYSRRESEWNDPLPTMVTPALLERQVLGETVMTWPELEKIAEDDLNAQMEMHHRRAEPWAGMILLMLGSVAVLRRIIHGATPSYIHSIVTSVLVCVGFYIFREAFISLGEIEFLSPATITWFPLIVSGGGGFLLLRKMDL